MICDGSWCCGWPPMSLIPSMTITDRAPVAVSTSRSSLASALGFQVLLSNRFELMPALSTPAASVRARRSAGRPGSPASGGSRFGSIVPVGDRVAEGDHRALGPSQDVHAAAGTARR